jgi:hypothetical protein
MIYIVPVRIWTRAYCVYSRYARSARSAISIRLRQIPSECHYLAAVTDAVVHRIV